MMRTHEQQQHPTIQLINFLILRMAGCDDLLDPLPGDTSILASAVIVGHNLTELRFNHP